MKPKSYAVLDMAVNDGVSYGVNRAFKHTSNPLQENIALEVYQAVMNSIHEWFDFDATDTETSY